MLDRITFVLHHTRLAENAGAAARALCNMGLSRLVLADPAGFDLTMAGRVAAEARGFLESAEVAPSLEAALSEQTFLVATTARSRRGHTALDPDRIADEALRAAGDGLSVAFLFGDEKNGLPRAIFDRAHLVSTVPTAKDAPSLNLAQAVLVHAWALRRRALEFPAAAPAPAMAPDSLSRLRARARALLLSAGYLDPQRPDRVLGALERMILRAHPTEEEAKLLLALVRQLEWAVGRTP